MNERGRKYRKINTHTHSKLRNSAMCIFGGRKFFMVTVFFSFYTLKTSLMRCTTEGLVVQLYQRCINCIFSRFFCTFSKIIILYSFRFQSAYLFYYNSVFIERENHEYRVYFQIPHVHIYAILRHPGNGWRIVWWGRCFKSVGEEIY